MDLFTALHTRRSIRRYTQEPVTQEEIRVLLDAAMIAPSAGNARPWQFVIIDDPQILAGIPDIHPYAGMASKAPLAILVCGDPNAEKHAGFWVQDCSAATQNLLLAATGLGLGAVWAGLYPVEDRVASFRKLADLPQHIVPFALTVIGRPDVQAESKSRFDPEKVHYNAWKRRPPYL